MSEAEDFLRDAAYEVHDSVKFPNVGDTFKGRVVSEPRVVETTEDNGERTPKLVVAMESEADGNTYDLWIKRGGQANAIANAVKETGRTRLEVDGVLAVRHTGLGEPKQKGWNAPKLWAAKYEAPKAGANLDDIFGGI